MALHPFVQKMMEGARAAGRPALSAGTPADARELVASARTVLGTGPAVGEVRDLDIPSRAGSVPARLYRSAEGDEDGLIVYVHGGGWVCGTLDDFDLLARALVDKSGCAVVSVDYRLAPEHPFPAGLEDVEDVIAWASEHMSDLIGTTVALVVAGDSAGANLATVALAHLGGGVAVALQCLFYPVADTDTGRPSYLAHGEGLPLTRADMQWFFSHYADTSLHQNPRIAPVRNQDLAGSPPAWIALAEYDVLLDEGLAYAQRLRDCGVPVSCVTVPGLAHGFVRLFNHVPEADAAIAEAAVAIRRAVQSH
ncbi:MAG: alpha/beta hydrolase [Pseudomonadota bacterium]